MHKKKFLTASIFLINLVLFSAAKVGADPTADSVIVIGLDSLGKARATAIPKIFFRKNFSHALSTVQDSLIPNLEAQSLQTSYQRPKMEMRTLGVGVGITGQFGLGPLINITLSPRLRLIFTNSTSPIYPD